MLTDLHFKRTAFALTGFFYVLLKLSGQQNVSVTPISYVSICASLSVCPTFFTF